MNYQIANRFECALGLENAIHVLELALPTVSPGEQIALTVAMKFLRKRRDELFELGIVEYGQKVGKVFTVSTHDSNMVCPDGEGNTTSVAKPKEMCEVQDKETINAETSQSK